LTFASEGPPHLFEGHELFGRERAVLAKVKVDGVAPADFNDLFSRLNDEFEIEVMNAFEGTE